MPSRPIWIIRVLDSVGYVLQFEGQVFATASDAVLMIGSATLIIPIITWLKRAGMVSPALSLSSIILPTGIIVSVALSLVIFRDPFNIFPGKRAVLIAAGV